MMIAFLRRNLTHSILKDASLVGGRSPSDFSFSVRLFSKSQLGISPNLLDLLLHKHNFPPEVASRVASELSTLKTPEKAGPVLSFFKISGFSDAQLIKIVKQRPSFFMASLEDTIKPKIKIFRDLGLSSNEISKIISSNPTILSLSLKNNILPSLSLLNGYLGSNDKVCRVIARTPRLLAANFENTMVPNVEFLKSCGVPMHRISSVLFSFPTVFTMKPELVRKSAEKAKEMAIDASCNSFIYAIPTLLSMSNESWDIKLQAFRDLGFSDRDILVMFNNTPPVFMGSMEKIRKIVELLLATRKFNLSSVVNYPQSLTCSIEKKYKPRLRILGILESRGLIKEWPTLAKLHYLTDDKFCDEFIRPYQDEVGMLTL